MGAQARKADDIALLKQAEAEAADLVRAARDGALLMHHVRFPICECHCVCAHYAHDQAVVLLAIPTRLLFCYGAPSFGVPPPPPSCVCLFRGVDVVRVVLCWGCPCAPLACVCYRAQGQDETGHA